MRLLVHSLVVSNIKRLIHTGSPKTPVLVKDAIYLWEDIFKKNNISEPTHSIQIILHSVLAAKSLVEVKTRLDEELNLTQRKQLDEYCLQRLNRMPVQYIIEEWDFRELTLAMRGPVFIPRPETEQLLDIILAEQQQQPEMHSPKSIVEIGCGSGAIAIAMAKAFTQADIVAIDMSLEACALTVENCRRFAFSEKVQVINTRLLQNGSLENGRQLSGVDILVSNPPYIKTDHIRSLQPEITIYEDLRAVDGGADGMQVIFGLLLLAADALNCNGRLSMEIEPGLVPSIELWMAQNGRRLGLTLAKVYKDIYHVDRFVSIVKEAG